MTDLDHLLALITAIAVANGHSHPHEWAETVLNGYKKALQEKPKKK